MPPPARTTAGPNTARKMPPIAGPSRPPSPSIVASPTFAATSSSGAVASAGSNANWIDRRALEATAAAAISP